ncbi:hypothetical protein [Candidatus Laterigemmans baculatus]|uniref:hypothetical protein n=1 Tax=Candidatus Laterigemmans baculatus TaxID=2770505 RepID=UPI0013DCB373|nr:hypothetical protein [Candidatus Laterigemmans baculatus]
MTQITASGSFHGHDLEDLPVLNLGDWFGKTWLIEIGGSYSPLFLVVEADSFCSAIEELADNEKYGHLITVADEDLGDYDPNDCHYGPSGQILELDHIMIHGDEQSKMPWPCRYHGEGLTEEGVLPTAFEHCDDTC